MIVYDCIIIALRFQYDSITMSLSNDIEIIMILLICYYDCIIFCYDFVYIVFRCCWDSTIFI